MIMKNIFNKYIYVIILLYAVNTSIAQEYSNEWINYNQQYFKIHVSKDGLYKITYNELLSAGVPVGAIDPRWIQIFYKGEEQYIYIHGENSTGIFDPNGYIEFYGIRNKGEQDNLFFDNASNRVNNDYSFYNDTSAYFITWNNSTTNRRIETINDTDYASYQSDAQSFCIKNKRVNYTGYYHLGATRGLFTKGEGWFDNVVITEENPIIKTISLPQIYNTTDNVSIEIAVAGTPANMPNSFVPHHLKVEFLGQVQIDETYSGYEFIRKTKNIPANQFSESLQLKFTANDVSQPNINDRNVVSYIDVKYPHSWNFENSNYFEFILPSNPSSSKDYIEINHFNGNTQTYMYDLTNHKRFVVTNSSSLSKTLVDNTGSERKMVISNVSGYKNVDRITKISPNNKFTDYFSENQEADYLIVTHPKLMSSCNLYKSYRDLNGHNVVLLNVEHLYDQYAYGINKHPAAIRNIAKRYYDYSQKERFLFLVGKSIHLSFFRNNTTHYSKCLVPSAGNPSSDNLFTIRFDGNNFNPTFGTGRLSASTNNQVNDYLDKVTTYEANPREEWMKRIIHFGGGSNAAQQVSFANFLHNYELTIEDTLFGGKVSTFLKNSSDPIQITQTDSIYDLIETGVTMVTYFGHASSSGFDQNIDFPDNYNNIDKYPFILANSCFAGDIHQTTSASISESWINIANRGAISFLATTGQGISSYLNSYSSELYKQIGYKNYGKPLSLQIINTCKEVENTYLSSSVFMEITCHEFTLHGDPGVILNSFEKPDLVITPDLIKFIPEEITTVQDSFDVRIVIKNIGRAIQDTFYVYVNRTYPNGNNEQIESLIYGCNYLDTLTLRLPVDRYEGAGLNKLKVFVDAVAQIDELSELNNETTVSFIIKSGDLFPIYPYKYSIYPNQNVELIASTGDPFTAISAYKFQIDTTDKFNSSILTETSIQSEGGIVSWNVPFNLTENRVYYWRICREHNNPDSVVWKESSFIYIDGEEGWSQAHYYQFKEDEFSFIKYLPVTQDFEYIEVPKRLNCHNDGKVNVTTIYEIGWNIDGSTGEGLGGVSNCGMPSAMLLVVIDPTTLRAWFSDKQDFGHRNYPQCFSSNSPQSYFSFNTDEAGLDSLKSLIDFVPDGHYILTYSWANANYSNWSEELLQTFENLGGSNIRNMNDGVPYILFSQKGTTYTEEIYGTSPESEIDLPEKNLITDFNYGYIKSVEIGPSARWESFNWMQFAEENPTKDESWINIYGITPQDNEELVIEKIEPNTYEILELNDSIDYQQYPNLRLEFFTQDTAQKTPAQLDKWQLRFIGVPETAISPQDGYFFCCDTIDEGDDFSFAVATKNISTYDMDSLVVKYWLKDNDNIETLIDIKKLGNHPAGDIIIDTITYSSLGLSGINSIWLEYNPLNEQTGTYYQPEQQHFNNIAVKYFFVQKDITNPILDVSFDGRYIMNGEIVSAKPEILIKLNDENKYLELNDTSLFRIYITNMQTGVEERIYFNQPRNSNETIEFTPANLPNNSCKIIYKPVFPEDGNYRLRVQAKDVSANESGDNDYVIDFEVVNASTITNLLNYPNPFSSSTRFVFELTGSDIPDEVEIRIFTITGKLVKQITIDEIGPIYIGKNITEYAWDGKDMFGDQLANGVYFYQVIAKVNGKDIDHRTTEADKYFKKEIGKMYLMR